MADRPARRGKGGEAADHRRIAPAPQVARVVRRSPIGPRPRGDRRRRGGLTAMAGAVTGGASQVPVAPGISG